MRALPSHHVSTLSATGRVTSDGRPRRTPLLRLDAMCGTSTRFWKAADAAGDSNAFGGVFFTGAVGRELYLSASDHLNLFLFDEETARDLAMMPEKKNAWERKRATGFDAARRTLFEHGGLIDRVLRKDVVDRALSGPAPDAGVISSHARDMLVRAVLLP